MSCIEDCHDIISEYLIKLAREKNAEALAMEAQLVAQSPTAANRPLELTEREYGIRLRVPETACGADDSTPLAPPSSAQSN